MSLRKLVEGDCGGVNPLMQLGGQFVRDAARKDEGFMQQGQFERSMHQDEQMMNEFLGQVAGPPQSFQMQTLLQEMREIEQQTNVGQFQAAPRVIDEVASGMWSKEFAGNIQNTAPGLPQMVHMQPRQQQTMHVREFFDETGETISPLMNSGPRFRPPMPATYMANCPAYQRETGGATSDFFEQHRAIEDAKQAETTEDWISDYQSHKDEEAATGQNYNEQFWQRLQDQWQTMASEDTDHPWLSEYSENYDPYKVYEFAEENPMTELNNAFEKGKEYLARGDIPSAVLCFEVAAKKEPENADIWELLGLSQAENEMDPQSIAALKRSLEIRPDNRRVLMALAVCYTNESLLSHALKMLTNWLQINPKYQHIIERHKNVPEQRDTAAAVAAFTSSLIRGSQLQDVQNMFLDAVRQNPHEIDAEVQEALGVLYNLSAEYDKAVDCFRAALQTNPQSAKLWNRLGASLANGTRSVEAVEAYQQALQLQPGFIRVRYNVGVCCMNLNAYKQAVEHLLTALNMQANSAAAHELPAGAAKNGQLKMSESIWSTLRMVISLMGRHDLHGFVTDRNLEALNDAFKD